MGRRKAVKNRKWSSRFFEKERAEFFKRQKGCCAICGKHQSSFKRRLCLDHNHKTLKLRGLLCFYCNKRLVGRLDYPTALKVVNYLKVENGK